MMAKIDDYRDKPIKGKYVLIYKGNEKVPLYTDVEDESIRETLQEFINYFNDKRCVYNTIMRIFLKGFKESISEEMIFSEELFSIQYKFFNDLGKELESEGVINSRDKIKVVLVSFYRFISAEKKEFKLSKIFMEAITSKTFYKFYDKGYKFVFYNSFEEAPMEDKICIIPSEETLVNADVKNIQRKGIDFTLCTERYREDLKKFIWNNWISNSTFNHYPKLVEFLNLSDYIQYSNNIIRLNKSNKEFEEDFLWNYKMKIQDEVENSGQRKCIFKIIRKYLKYYETKYNVSKTDLDIFNLSKLDNYDGGEEITENDRKLIYKEFKEKEAEDEAFRIYTIVFEIFITTKFRLGEILNFRRDNVIKYDDGSYGIRYISKTSNKEFVEEKISMETAHLLLEAINISKSISEKDLSNGVYIFVEGYKGNNNLKCKRIEFQMVFRNIIRSLKGKLEKDNYKPNNIRNTFINNVYKEGKNQGLTIPEMALIAGNSYKTANKHYREQNELLDYLEATNGICIADVNINGTITKEKDDDRKNIVKDGLGICNSENCSFPIGECLICNNFITFTNRENNFKDEIEKLDKMIMKTDNEYEIEELQAYKKLLLRYIYEIKVLNGEEGVL